MSDEVGACGLEVVDDEEQPLDRAGAAVVMPLPKMVEHGEPGGVICTPRNVAGGEIGVQPPAPIGLGNVVWLFRADLE
jgi:hypothetical protein